jgi:hypothetical protein
MATRTARPVIGLTLDSNIYVSALQFGGIGTRFLGMARAGSIRIDTSEAILAETMGVLRLGEYGGVKIIRAVEFLQRGQER